MEIWLKQGKEELRLPVLPSSYGLVYSQANTEVNITNLGAVNIIGKRNLATASIESFFPNHKYGFVQYKKFPTPKNCIKLIKSWMDNPIRYIVTGTGTNLLMTIEEFTYNEQDGTGDIYFSLSLKEYSVPKVVTKKKKSQDKNNKKIVKPTTNRESKKVTSTIYIVKKGDTLSSIAKRLTGDSNNWRAIYNQNKSVIGGNPNKIHSGQKLVIK